MCIPIQQKWICWTVADHHANDYFTYTYPLGTTHSIQSHSSCVEYILHYTGWDFKLRLPKWHPLCSFNFMLSATYDCMCRRELSVGETLLFPVFTNEVISKVVHHTCVPYWPQSTDQLLRVPLHLLLLLPRELQPLPEVHPILLSGAHCVPSVSSQQLLQWVQCGVHHPQPDEVCELPVHCHCTPWQSKGKPHCRGRQSCKVSDCNWSTQGVDGLAG